MVAQAALWTLLWLVCIDVCIGRLIPAPDPLAEPTKLQAYFEYGRSVEGKLHKMVRDTDAQSSPVVTAGWIGTAFGPEDDDALAAANGRIVVRMYGQSFTQILERAVAKIEPRIKITSVGGAGASLSHSYSFFEADPHKADANVVVLGVLASSLARLTSLTNMSVWFESPSPATYSRYFLRDGKLERVEPKLRSLAELRRALRDPTRWRAFRDQLAEHDAAFAAGVFDASPLDASVFGRLLRRARGQAHSRDIESCYHDARGFINRDGLIDVARALLTRFASEARGAHQIPYIVFFDDRGFSTHLDEALAPHLRTLGVSYMSSSLDAPPSDARSYVPNGHFLQDLDERMARRFVRDVFRLTGKQQ